MSSCDMRECGEDPDIARANPGYDHEHNFSFSRHAAPEVCKIFRPKKVEGAGKTGCALHPRSHVQMHLAKNAHEHTGSAEAFRPSLRDGFTAYIRALPGDRLS